MPTARLARRTFRAAALLLALALLLEIGERVAVAVDGDMPPAADESLVKEWRWARTHLAAGRATFESAFAHDPLAGWRNAPLLRRDGMSTNSAGLRGSREYPVARAPGLRRMVLVGDSYSFGSDVRDEETFAQQLESGGHADGWEVLNLAVPGTGTDQQVITFEHDGRRHAPDVAVLGFFTRDYNRITLSFRDYAKPMFVVDEAARPDGLRLTHSPVIAPEALYADYVSGRRRVGGSPLRSWALAALLAGVSSADEWDAGPGVPAWELLSRLMGRFQRLALEAGAVPVWLVIPARDCLEPGGSGMAALEDAGERRARELGLACLRLDAVFRAHAAAHPQDDIYRDDAVGGHLSALGNRLVAEDLARLVRGLELPPR
jgi:hypothetical protein